MLFSIHMQYVRWILSLGALVFGILILALSLSTANSSLYASGSPETSQKQFYMGQTILPDHVAYPVLMAMDRVKLELDTPQERVYTQVDYSQRRFEYGLALLDKDNQPLAVSTITKSQKYLFQAAQEAVDTQASAHTLQFVLKALNYYREELIALKPLVSDEDRVAIDRLIGHNEALSHQVADQLASNSAHVSPSAETSLESN